MTRRWALMACAAWWAGHAAAQLSLDPTNTQALQSTTIKVLRNLMGFYQPSSTGVFDQTPVPWHASSMIWATFMDYQKWTGDNQFASEVTGALVNLSYGSYQDVLGGPLTTTNEKILGKWNDDIGWPAIAITGGAEIYGIGSIMPGAQSDGPQTFTAPPLANGSWGITPERTLDEMWEYEDDKCGGGIYWSRNPALNSIWKSTITELEFIQSAVRLYNLNGNSTLLHQAQSLWDWLYKIQLIRSDGTVGDGVNTTSCGPPSEAWFTYNYGLALGDAAWFHYVTQNSTYLDQAARIFYRSKALFYDNFTVVTELCEQLPENCARDAEDFKAVYLRNLAYLWRETQDANVRSSITGMINSSLQVMITKGCTSDYYCNGNWTASEVKPVEYVRSQHVAAALLVSALGIHANITGVGLMPQVDGGSLNQTGDSTAGQSTGPNLGYLTSTPLAPEGGALTLRARGPLLVFALLVGLAMVV